MRWLMLVLSVTAGGSFLLLKRSGRKPAELLVSLISLSPRRRDRLLACFRRKWTGDEEEALARLKDYRIRKVRRLLIALPIGLFALFLLSFCGKKEETVSGALLRGEAAGSLLLKGSIPGVPEEELVLSIPALEPGEKQKILWLGEADRYVRDYFDALGPLYGPPELPREWEHAMFSYYSLEPEKADHEGRLLIPWPEEGCELPFRVVVWVDDLKSTVEVKLRYAPASALSASQQWTQLKAQLSEGRFLEEEALILPEETDGGLPVHWARPSTGPDIGLCLLILLLVLAFLSERKDAALEAAYKKSLAGAEKEGPELISELLLYLEAGMSAQNAWLRIGEEAPKRHEKSAARSRLREEISLSAAELRNGISFSEVLQSCAGNCSSRDVRRAARLLIEDRSMGNRELSEELKEICENAWEAQRLSLRERMEKADTRLLLPIMLMFCVILIITAAPALMEIKGL